MRKRLEKIMTENIPKLKGKEELMRLDVTRIADDLQMDSFDIVTLQVVLEDNFGFVFNPLEDDFEEIFQTMGNLEQFVRSKYGVK